MNITSTGTKIFFVTNSYIYYVMDNLMGQQLGVEVNQVEQHHLFISSTPQRQRLHIEVTGGQVFISYNMKRQIEGFKVLRTNKKRSTQCFRRIGNVPFQKLKDFVDNSQWELISKMLKLCKRTQTEKQFFLKMIKIKTKAKDAWTKVCQLVSRELQKMVSEAVLSKKSSIMHYRQKIHEYICDMDNGDFEVATKKCFGRQAGDGVWFRKNIWAKQLRAFEMNDNKTKSKQRMVLRPRKNK